MKIKVHIFPTRQCKLRERGESWQEVERRQRTNKGSQFPLFQPSQ
jgi:hypothetical protein